VDTYGRTFILCARAPDLSGRMAIQSCFMGEEAMVRMLEGRAVRRGVLKSGVLFRSLDGERNISSRFSSGRMICSCVGSY
jgi:hypothetical protein